MRRAVRVAAVMILLALVTGCGIRIPADPNGTLDTITDGRLRVGASPSGDLVHAEGAEVSGPLADLVEEFAAERHAVVEWSSGSEEDLVDRLEDGTLDLAIGGMTGATPWSDRVSVTRGYTGIPGSGERPVVILLPLGENALQSALEGFLDGEVGQ